MNKNGNTINEEILEMENKQLNDEQLNDAAGGSFLKDMFGDDVGGVLEDAWDTVKTRIIPEPPKPNPFMDPNSFKIPDQYDPMK